MSQVKVLAPVSPRAGLTGQEFHDHWRHPHASYGAQSLLSRSYVQSHRIDCNLLGSDQQLIEGVAEVWYESLDDAIALTKDRYYLRDLAPDEPTFVDMSNLRFVVCHEEVLMSGPGSHADASSPDILWRWDRRPTSIKVLQFIEIEGPERLDSKCAVDLGRRVRALRHVVCTPLAAVHGDSAPFLRVRELWWPTLTAFRTGAESDPAAWKQLISEPAKAITLLAQTERYW
jgi:hypothetical protein